MATRYTYDYVKNYFEAQGCKLLSTEYHNNKEKLDYICECGNQSQIRFDSFQKGSRCWECRGKKITDSQLHSYEYVKEYFEKAGCKLLSTEYHGTHEKLDYVCSCGNVAQINFHSFQQGNRCRKCGNKKLSESMKGKNNHMYGKFGQQHHNWNPNLTDEERMDKRRHPEYFKWRNAVFERDNYTCLVCKQRGGALEAHHYFNYSEHKELRYNIDNGITLCEDCHDEYHSKFNKKGNSKAEFFLFMWQKRLSLLEGVG